MKLIPREYFILKNKNVDKFKPKSGFEPGTSENLNGYITLSNTYCTRCRSFTTKNAALFLSQALLLNVISSLFCTKCLHRLEVTRNIIDKDAYNLGSQATAQHLKVFRTLGHLYSSDFTRSIKGISLVKKKIVANDKELNQEVTNWENLWR